MNFSFNVTHMIRFGKACSRANHLQKILVVRGQAIPLPKLYAFLLSEECSKLLISNPVELPATIYRDLKLVADLDWFYSKLVDLKNQNIAFSDLKIIYNQLVDDLNQD